MESSYLGELLFLRSSRNKTVTAHLVRSLRTASPETPHGCGDSGKTPDRLLGLPTSTNQHSRKVWCGDSALGVRRLRTVRKLRGPSGPTPHAHLVVPTT